MEVNWQGIIDENEKVLTIVSGINGAGKSSFKRSIKEKYEAVFGESVNLDEIMELEFKNKWDEKNIYKATVMYLEKLDTLSKKQKTFHLEWTLVGLFEPTIIEVIKALKNGFKLNLIYVGIESPMLASERIWSRRKKEVPLHNNIDSLTKKYEKSIKNLSRFIPICDIVAVYDNSTEGYLNANKPLFFKNKDIVMHYDQDMPQYLNKALRKFKPRNS